jgi:hypothetical protein
MSTSSIDLTRLRAALVRLKEVGDKATPGPWMDDGDGLLETEGGGAVAFVIPYANLDVARRLGQSYSVADAAFIALARDLPAADLLEGWDSLLALAGEVERLREEIRQLRDTLVEMTRTERLSAGMTCQVYGRQAHDLAVAALSPPAPDDGHEQDERDA